MTRIGCIRARRRTNPPASLHVIPQAGPEHAASDDCWCAPHRDEVDRRIVVHRLLS